MPAKKRMLFEFESITLDPASEQTQYRQLENQLRQAISQGFVEPGSRVPSTRRLAELLSLSRNTVTAAYQQLLSEGYLESTVGSGTRVTGKLPEPSQFHRSVSPKTKHQPILPESLSETGLMLTKLNGSIPALGAKAEPFRPHLPDLDAFPVSTWNRFASEQARHSNRHLDTGDPQGYEPLRASIAQYMAVSRGVNCTKNQVVITSGAQQGLTLVTHVLLDPGAKVWVEEPGNMPANQLLAMLGMQTVPVPLDDEGIDFTRVPPGTGKPKLIYVTPGSQWPMGMTMSLNRRMQLLADSQRLQSWILEDDYNGEYRYTGRPHPALCSLDTQGRTIYMGTFSKYLFPAIRLGFLIVPASIRSAFAQARWLLDRYSPTLPQQVLHRFIESGEFLKHLRKMRILYQRRQRFLHERLSDKFERVATIELPDTGMHLVIQGHTKRLDERLTVAAKRAGVEYHLVRAYSQCPTNTRGLVLGFAAFNEASIKATVDAWACGFDIAKS